MSLRLECSIHCACVTVSCFTELQKCLLCFPTWNIVTCILCMGFATAMHVLLLKNTKRRFPDRRIPSRGVFTRINQTLHDTGCLPSVAVRSEREVVQTINTRENILKMVQRSPRLSIRRMASRIGVNVCRCGELYMRKIYILTMIKGYNIWNQPTMLNVWICAAG